MPLDLKIIHFCATECSFQESGEMSVSWMCNAWLFAQSSRHAVPTLDDMQMVGKLVEPVVNANGFRRTPVRIGYETLSNQDTLASEAVNLMEAVLEGRVTAEEFYYAYQRSHFWADGNGRSGVLLANWIQGTLDNPVFMPDFWGGQGRRPGHGAPLLSDDHACRQNAAGEWCHL